MSEPSDKSRDLMLEGFARKSRNQSLVYALMAADPEIEAIASEAVIEKLVPEILSAAKVVVRSRQQSPTPAKTVVNESGNEIPFKS